MKNLNDFLIAIVKICMIHNFCEIQLNVEISCMITNTNNELRECEKKFSKSFMNQILLLKNDDCFVYA